MIRRLLLGILAGTLLLCLAAAALAYWFFSSDGVRTTLERQASDWLGQPVHIGSAHAAFYPRLSIRLEQVAVGTPVRLTLARVDVSAPLRPLLERRIVDADILVSDTDLHMPLPFGLPAGDGDTATTAGGSNGEGIRVESVRSISLRNVRITSRGRTISVAAESSLAGTRLNLHTFSAVSGRTRLDAAGVVALAPRVDARLRVKANRLDLDELLALAAAFQPAPSSARGAGLPARIVARVSAEDATAGGVNIRQFATDFEADGARVSLSPMSFQLFGGRYEGALAATVGATMRATLRARLTGLDVAQLAAFGGVPDAVSGTLSGAGRFEGHGSDVAAVLGSAAGSATATITNGTLRRLDLVRTVILFFGRPAADAPAATDAFERLDARFTLAGQVVRADGLSLRSRDADMVGRGTLRLQDKALDGTLDLSLSEKLSSEAGRDLYRYTREGNRVVLPARIGGTLAAPRLTIDAAAAVKRGLRNEVERRLEGLLDRFTREP